MDDPASSAFVRPLPTSLTISVSTNILYKGVFFISGTNLLADNAENWMFGISPASFGVIGAVLNFAVAYVVSNATKEPPLEVQDLVESIRIPRGAGAAVDH